MTNIVSVDVPRQALHRWVMEESGLVKGPQLKSLQELIETAIDEGLRLGKPAYLFDVMPVINKRHDRMVVAKGEVDNAWFASMMAPADKLMFVLCTVGVELEQQAQAYMAQQNAPLGYFLDTIGTGLVEMARCAAIAHAEAIAAEYNYQASIPISPGDTAWPLEQQRVIFNLLPADELGISLSEQCLMTPLKSTSFVIGLGSDMGTAAEGSACDYCDLRDRCKLRLTREAKLVQVEGNMVHGDSQD